MSLGLKPSKKRKELVGALKALRHPKPRHPKTGDTAPPETDDAAHPKREFSPNCSAMKSAIQTVEI
jgi:hypothetical protein